MGNAPANTSGRAVPLKRRTLHHHHGVSLDWTSGEQSKLEDLLIKYGSDPHVARYAKIAKDLRGKTVRDIALRCRWMNVSL